MDGVLKTIEERGRDAWSHTLVDTVRAAGRAGVEPLLALLRDDAAVSAPPPRGWAPIHACRLLGLLGVTEAVPRMLELLPRGRRDDDYLGSQVLMSLQSFGPSIVAIVVDHMNQSSDIYTQQLCMEVIAGIAETHADAVELEPARRAIERVYGSAEPHERGVVAAYLGELGDATTVPVLLAGLPRERLTRAVYESVRDAVERLGGSCPDFYFDVEGKGYPLDDEKLPHCPGCGRAMTITASGLLSHPAVDCATLDGGTSTFPSTS
jgi:hypothetical protein